jgi:hypothetical protein
MDKACSTHKMNSNVVKLDTNRPLGRPTRVREGNIRTDLREIELGGMNWIHLALDRN